MSGISRTSLKPDRPQLALYYRWSNMHMFPLKKIHENSWDGRTSYGSTYLCKMGWTHTFQQIFSSLHVGAVTNWTLAGGQLLRTLQVENMSACLASALLLGLRGWNWANSSGSPSPVCPLPRGKPIWTHYKPARLKVCDSVSWMPLKHCLKKKKLVFLHTGTAKQLKHLSKKTTSPSEIAYEQTAEAPVPDKLRIRWPPLPSLPPACQAWESWMRSQDLCVRNCIWGLLNQGARQVIINWTILRHLWPWPRRIAQHVQVTQRLVGDSGRLRELELGSEMQRRECGHPLWQSPLWSTSLLSW